MANSLTSSFTEQEIDHKKLVIRDNSIDSMTSLLKAMIDLNIRFDNPELEVKAKDMLVLSRNNILEDMQMGNEIISGSISITLSQLWADKGVQKCYKRRNEFQLEDCAKHILDNLERIWSPDYKPTNQDILYSRVRTTGVQEIQFQAQLRTFQVYDVGGQRSERRKWTHLFDIVDSVIFIAALSDYNIVMHAEDKEKNSLLEALELFEAVLGIEWFADKAMILFLNKKDLFEENLELFPLKELFPEFEGPTASGKSTILKQMIILHAKGFSETEIQQRKVIIRKNMVDNMATLLKAMKNLRIDLENDELEVKANIVHNAVENQMTHELKPMDEIESSLHLALNQLWADQGVQRCFKRRNEFHLEDCAKHVLDNVDRICSPMYKPTNQDILYSRACTVGVQEIKFQAQESLFCVYDVGGQRTERRKWIHHFDIVDSVIFIAALSDYNIMSYDDDENKKNALDETLDLFESILNMEWFIKKAMILFLNKKDLFEENLQSFPLKELFPEYDGGPDYELSVTFLTAEFKKRNRTGSRKIYTHTTCATDTDQVEKVIDSVINLVISVNVIDSGFE